MIIKNVAIVGMGAVGCAVAYHFLVQEYYNFFVVAKGTRAEKIFEQGIKINNEIYYPKIINDKNPPLDLLIVTVKNYNLDQTIEDIKDVVSENTMIIPLLNGVTAPDTIRSSFPNNKVLNGIILRTDANRIDNEVTFSTTGEIQIGYENNDDIKPEEKEICDCLNKVRLNAHVYKDMKRMQWRKWMINIGCNQVSVESGAEFYYFGKVNEIVELMKALMDEVLLIAKAEGVNLTEKDRDEVIDIIINYPPYKKTSMLQDLEAHRQTEIDYFAGTVIKYGQKHGIATPVNYALYLTIKAKEKVYIMKKSAVKEFV